jgi:hypothetical protein
MASYPTVSKENSYSEIPPQQNKTKNGRTFVKKGFPYLLLDNHEDPVICEINQTPKGEKN